MLVAKQKKWNKQFSRLIEPTKICKLCFKSFYPKDIVHIFNDINVCLNCFREIEPKFIEFKVGQYKAISIYEYGDKIKELLYQFKGCFDIEISDVFLGRYARELKLMYEGYLVVPVPSYYEDDEIREFNHVEEMFKFLKLPMRKVIVKTDKIKQADKHYNERQEIGNHLKLIGGEDLKNKKLLIVDDVYTTGSTVKAVISLLETLRPKTIKILVMSKTPDKEKLE